MFNLFRANRLIFQKFEGATRRPKAPNPEINNYDQGVPENRKPILESGKDKRQELFEEDILEDILKENMDNFENRVKIDLLSPNPLVSLCAEYFLRKRIPKFRKTVKLTDEDFHKKFAALTGEDSGLTEAPLSRLVLQIDNSGYGFLTHEAQDFVGLNGIERLSHFAHLFQGALKSRIEKTEITEAEIDERKKTLKEFKDEVELDLKTDNELSVLALYFIKRRIPEFEKNVNMRGNDFWQNFSALVNSLTPYTDAQGYRTLKQIISNNIREEYSAYIKISREDILEMLRDKGFFLIKE